MFSLLLFSGQLGNFHIIQNIHVIITVDPKLLFLFDANTRSLHLKHHALIWQCKALNHFCFSVWVIYIVNEASNLFLFFLQGCFKSFLLLFSFNSFHLYWKRINPSNLRECINQSCIDFGSFSWRLQSKSFLVLFACVAQFDCFSWMQLLLSS